jgi:hypothetical protein
MDEEQKQKYAQLSPAQQRIIDSLPDNQKGSAVDFAWAVANADKLENPNATAQTQTSAGTTPIGGDNVVWTPNVTSSTKTVADLSTTSGQAAIGVTGQRRVQVVQLPSGRLSQEVVPGSYTGYDPTVVTPYGALQKTPKYFEGDEDQIATFRPEEIATIQKRMQKAGLLGSKYRIGVADDATVSKFKEVLAQANRTGSNWDAALNTLQASQQAGGGLTYKVSNPEDIRAVVQQTASKVLGRSADDQLVTRIVKSYQQLQVEEQQGMTVGGMRTGAPDVGVFAETQLREGTGGDAEAFRFAQFASRVLGS